MRLFALMLVFPLLVMFAQPSLSADGAPVYIGFDGEFGLKNSTSAQAIEKGLTIGIEEINANGGVLGGRPLKLLTRDNRSVPARGIENIKLFAQQEDLVAVVGGRFSPVILSELATVHELKIPLMDAWGSADGITEHTYSPGYVFRVSLRDRFAMPTMLRHAQKNNAKRIGLLLPNTGWGRSNANAAERYISSANADLETKLIWYNWGDKDFGRFYQTFQDWGADTLVLVANDIEGSLVVRHIASLPQEQRLPVISHWGVTGGHFVQACQGGLSKIDFSVVQTFNFDKADPDVRAKVLDWANRLYGLERVEDIQAPVGFGQAYDIVQILAQAIDLAGSTERTAVRDALENVSHIKGLVRTYDKPFGPGDYDALDLENVFMARYDADGVIRPLDSD